MVDEGRTEHPADARAGADGDDSPEEPARPSLPAGTRVEVRSGFDGSWERGFVVVQATEVGYVLRRDGDDTLLPELPAAQVRRQRRRETWWV